MHIYPGSEHSIALTSDGGVFTWGSSRCGQLGHGTTSSEILPRRILELMGTLVTQVERRNCRMTTTRWTRVYRPYWRAASTAPPLFYVGPVSTLMVRPDFLQYQAYHLRPYHVDNISSCLITSVKQHWTELVLGWVTAW